MATIRDDRTETQRETHRWAVIGTDPFMSGWGGAQGGASYAGWACTSADADACLRMVRRRGDMLRVRLVSLPGYRASGAAHCHIYVYGAEA
jgi:hypothetical protein